MTAEQPQVDDGPVVAVQLRRDAEERPHIIGIPHTIRRHSPSGMEWGYTGSGPMDLSLNLLNHWFGQRVAERNYRLFCHEVISRVPKAGGFIFKEVTEDWLKRRGTTLTEM